ncbi:interleukin 15, like isoform X3 [Chelmon rostratus]|uniref:interleukin 15, like isoform X3 n=1 Tax=Chelmon rostratus TaxID=109905 RepID=UPI001BEA6C0A|nr:interleukin 15, like isoform X3 [Chelmon rostratus]
MLRGRLALVSVHLCFFCLSALMPQPAANVCTKDIMKNVQFLINTSDLVLDCRLYTPTINDYQQNCPSATMKCFAAEISVLMEEWETIPYHGFGLDKKLEKLAKLLNQTESECHQCEFFKEQNAEKFLNNLHSTLQRMNSEHC